MLGPSLMTSPLPILYSQAVNGCGVGGSDHEVLASNMNNESPEHIESLDSVNAGLTVEICTSLVELSLHPVV